jgi:hypothetical protein
MTMTTINLSEFTKYTNKVLYEYLLIEGDTDFRIVIPIDVLNAKEEDNCMIYQDYCNAAYAGHFLWQIADEFDYTIPDPAKDKEFVFTIKISDMDKLADTLSFIIAGLYHYDKDVYVDFQCDSTQHICDAYDDKIETPCWGLFEVASKHLDKDNP